MGTQSKPTVGETESGEIEVFRMRLVTQSAYFSPDNN